jgi:hypothetical protein
MTGAMKMMPKSRGSCRSSSSSFHMTYQRRRIRPSLSEPPRRHRHHQDGEDCQRDELRVDDLDARALQQHAAERHQEVPRGTIVVTSCSAIGMLEIG